MITYEYRCDANETTLTVRHSINEKLESWGELCSLADYSPGDTPPDTPVKRLMSGGSLMPKSNNNGVGKPLPKPSSSGGCCGSC